jgi:hypothetical protein
MSSEREATFKEVVSNHSQKEKSLQREIDELRGQLDQVQLSFSGSHRPSVSGSLPFFLDRRIPKVLKWSSLKKTIKLRAKSKEIKVD